VKGYGRFEGFTAVIMKNTTFWDMMQCSLVDAYDISEEYPPLTYRVEEWPQHNIPEDINL
jgi:hypothetical protein